MPVTDDLLNYLFNGQPHPLYEPIAGWLGDSRRFTSFVTAFKDKIRKKLRTTRDPEVTPDLQLELETAYLLLREQALSVKYEPDLSKTVRTPDFAVTFTTSLTFMLEVTRIQAEPRDTVYALLADTIVGKLGQLFVQRSNVLLLSVEADLTGGDLQTAMRGLQQRAEGKDPAFLQRHGFRDRADFFHHYQRLSDVMVRGPHFEEARSVVTWTNPQTKHPLPGRVRTALYRSHSA